MQSNDLLESNYSNSIGQYYNTIRLILLMVKMKMEPFEFFLVRKKSLRLQRI